MSTHVVQGARRGNKEGALFTGLALAGASPGLYLHPRDQTRRRLFPVPSLASCRLHTELPS